MPYIQRKNLEAESEWSKQRYLSYLRETPCPVCDGKRLKPEVLAVTINGNSHLRRLRAEPRRSACVHGGADTHRPRGAHRRGRCCARSGCGSSS